LQAAYAAPVQRPAWLVAIMFSTPIRVSSYQTVTVSGYTWMQADVDVSRVSLSTTDIAGSIRIGNADDAFAAIVLAEGVAGRQIIIYGYDAAAAADADIVLLADCVGGRASVAPDYISIDVRESTAFASTPRTFVSAPTFTYLIPAGTQFRVNGQTYRIDRASS
jgi:hypothetical protein